MVIVKILEHLVVVLPPELFDEAVTIITKDEGSYQSILFSRVKTQSPLGGQNKFTKLLFNYLLAVRNKIWCRKFESQDSYTVSTSLVVLIRKMMENSVWRHIHEGELKESIRNVKSLNFQEQDAIMNLFGGELNGLSTGMIAKDKNDNKVTLLGFSDQWINDVLVEGSDKKKEVPKTTMGFEAKTNKAIGLFINESTIDNNEVMVLDPQELVLLENTAKRSATAALPIKDLLMDKDVMTDLIMNGVIDAHAQH